MGDVYVITEACLYVCAEPPIPRDEMKHLICRDVCPMDGIHFEPGKDQMCYIDPDSCINCGACFYECPVEAIYPIDDVPDGWLEYIELNAAWYHGDREKVRRRIAAIAP